MIVFFSYVTTVLFCDHVWSWPTFVQERKSIFVVSSSGCLTLWHKVQSRLLLHFSYWNHSFQGHLNYFVFFFLNLLHRYQVTKFQKLCPFCLKRRFDLFFFFLVDRVFEKMIVIETTIKDTFRRENHLFLSLSFLIIFEMIVSSTVDAYKWKLTRSHFELILAVILTWWLTWHSYSSKHLTFVTGCVTQRLQTTEITLRITLWWYSVEFFMRRVMSWNIWGSNNITISIFFYLFFLLFLFDFWCESLIFFLPLEQVKDCIYLPNLLQLLFLFLCLFLLSLLSSWSEKRSGLILLIFVGIKVILALLDQAILVLGFL